MPISPEAKAKIEDATAKCREQLDRKVRDGTVNAGELGAMVRELDFLKALEEVLGQ